MFRRTFVNILLLNILVLNISVWTSGVNIFHYLLFKTKELKTVFPIVSTFTSPLLVISIKPLQVRTTWFIRALQTFHIF